MAKINKEEEKKEYKAYDALDLKRMAEAVDSFKQERRGGRLQSRFDLYCESLGVIRFDQYGATIVRDASGYGTAIKMWYEIQSTRSRHAYAEKKDLQQLEEMAPEREKTAQALTIRKCLMCPTTLTPSLKYYCSGSCLAKARVQGTYGREEETAEDRAEREQLLEALA